MGGSKKNDEELLLKAIQHYQDGIGRYLERNDEIKVSRNIYFEIFVLVHIILFEEENMFKSFSFIA